MSNSSAGRKTWAKTGQFGAERLDIMYASEPESPQSPPYHAQNEHTHGENMALSPGFKSPSMSTFFDKRFTYGGSEGEVDENSAVSSSDITVHVGNEDSNTQPSPRQTWDIFIHDQPKSDTKAVRNIIQAWREKEIKSFNNLSDSGGSSKANKSNFLGDDLRTKSSLPHKRTLSSSIDQLNNIFDAMQADSSESDSQDSSAPQHGSLGYFKACATPQVNRKFPQAKKTVTFMDHKSGKVTPTRRRDRSHDGGQRSKLFDAPPPRNSQPVIHPMFKSAMKSPPDSAMDDPDLNDSIDSGVVVQEVVKSPTRKISQSTDLSPDSMTSPTRKIPPNIDIARSHKFSADKFKLNRTAKSPPPSFTSDVTDDDKVDATSNPFKNVLEQWQSNQNKDVNSNSKEMKLKNKANEERGVFYDESVFKDTTNNIIELNKPGHFIYSPSQLKSQRGKLNSDSSVFTFENSDKDLEQKNKTKSNFEVSQTLLDEFPTKLVDTPVKDTQNGGVIIKPMEKPIDEDIELHNVQISEKISMFEVKRPPKHPAQAAPKINRGRQLPKPPSGKSLNTGTEKSVNSGTGKSLNTQTGKSLETDKRLTLSEQFRTKAGRGRSGSPSLLASTSCTDIHRECNSPQNVSAPQYETQSLSRSRPKLRSNNAPKHDTNRARSKTPNFPRSTNENQTSQKSTPSPKPKTLGNKPEIKSKSPRSKSPGSKSPSSPRSNKASIVGNIVSKMNKQKPEIKAKPEQTKLSSANRFRSSSSSAILTAPIPFNKSKPPVYNRVPSITGEITNSAEGSDNAANKISSKTSVSSTTPTIISKVRRKMPEIPDSPKDHQESDTSKPVKTPEQNAPASGRMSPTSAKEFAGGRRTPEYFLRERHIASEKSKDSRGSPDIIVVTRKFTKPFIGVQDSVKKRKETLGSAANKRQLPTVSTSSGRKTPDIDANQGKPPLQRSSSGRAFPDSHLFERRSEVLQKRVEKQKNTAQRLYNRMLPSAPMPNTLPKRAEDSRAETEPNENVTQTSYTRRNMRSPSPSSRQGRTSPSPGLRQRVTSPVTRPGAASPSPHGSRSRERSRSPWQMMLAAGKLNQPKQSMASLGRSIARCLTPNAELMDAYDNEDDTKEPYVPLLRGRSEPNIASMFDSPMSPLSPTSMYSDNSETSDATNAILQSNRRPSLSNELEGEDSEISQAFSTNQNRRKEKPRERRQTVSGVPTMAEIERGKSPVPKLGETYVSQRFLRLSQGDLTAPTNTLDELMRNPPKHRGVRRTSSLRDFSNSHIASPFWSGSQTGLGGHGDESGSRNEGYDPVSKGQGHGRLTHGKPVKVFRDNDNGLVGYVFNV